MIIILWMEEILYQLATIGNYETLYINIWINSLYQLVQDVIQPRHVSKCIHQFCASAQVQVPKNVIEILWRRKIMALPALPHYP